MTSNDPTPQSVLPLQYDQAGTSGVASIARMAAWVVLAQGLSVAMALGSDVMRRGINPQWGVGLNYDLLFTILFAVVSSAGIIAGGLVCLTRHRAGPTVVIVGESLHLIAWMFAKASMSYQVIRIMSSHHTSIATELALSFVPWTVTYAVFPVAVVAFFRRSDVRAAYRSTL